MNERDSRRWLCKVVVLAVAALPRLWAAIWDQGIFWPDEIFQSLEQAHRFAFGYGFVSWEFQDGARSWLFPGLLGLLWKLLALLGVTSATTLVVAAKLTMVGLALLAIYAAMGIAERLAGEEAMLLCGILAASFPPSIVYGSRCMTEMASAPLCTMAVWLALDESHRKATLAGCLGGLAIFLRYQNGLLAVGLLVWLLAQRRRKDAHGYAGAALVMGLAGGILDLFTWGDLFHSFVRYIQFNLIEGRAAAFGVEPFDYYFTTVWSAVGIAIVPVVFGLALAARDAPGLLALVVIYIAAHTAVGHKELRFLMPIVPLALALSSVGLTRWWAGQVATPKSSTGAKREDVHPGGLVAPTVGKANWSWPVFAVVVVGALMGWRTVQATFDEFGQKNGLFSGAQSVWHAAEDVNRLLWLAGEQADLCSLLLVGYGPIWTGGYTYLHRDVPILWEPPLDDSEGNYVLARIEVELPENYTTMATIGGAKLARRSGTCVAPPAHYTRVFPKAG